jgi:arylsulfatase
VHGTPLENDVWELYHVAQDTSECNNLADELPDKLAELVELWWVEAETNGVFPLDERTLELFGARPREHSPHPPSRHYTYRLPLSPIPPQVAPGLAGRSWDMDAVIERTTGQDGCLYASGNANSGLALFILANRLHFDYNIFGEHHLVRSEIEVPHGRSVVGVRFRRLADGGSATLVIDEVEVGTMSVPFVMRMISSASTSVGQDHGSPVSELYEAPFTFAGTLERLDVQLISPPGKQARQEEAETDARTTMARQ